MENKKAYIDKFDIMKRYDVGTGTALGIIRAIRFFNGGGALPPGKILQRELDNWESRDEFNRRVFTPYSESLMPAELVSYSDASHPKAANLDEKRDAFIVKCKEAML